MGRTVATAFLASLLLVMPAAAQILMHYDEGLEIDAQIRGQEMDEIGIAQAKPDLAYADAEAGPKPTQAISTSMVCRSTVIGLILHYIG